MPRKQKVPIHTISIIIACRVIVMLLFLSSCSSQKKNLGEAILERDSLPGMKTLGVNTLISDSGIIRYKLIAEEWDIFDRKRPPYWAFEKGVYLEQFDSLYNVDASIKADTAYYYEKQKLWELRSNVSIKNRKGEKFDTELLFWNQNTQKVYSDKYIRIEQEDKIITGYGFESNQQLTQYIIHNSGGVFPINEAPKDSLKTDSIKNR